MVLPQTEYTIRRWQIWETLNERRVISCWIRTCTCRKVGWRRGRGYWFWVVLVFVSILLGRYCFFSSTIYRQKYIAIFDDIAIWWAMSASATGKLRARFSNSLCKSVECARQMNERGLDRSHIRQPPPRPWAALKATPKFCPVAQTIGLHFVLLALAPLF